MSIRRRPLFIRQIRVEKRCKSGVPLPAAATTFDTKLLALAETIDFNTLDNLKPPLSTH
jgi:hypothetical protein